MSDEDTGLNIPTSKNISHDFGVILHIYDMIRDRKTVEDRFASGEQLVGGEQREGVHLSAARRAEHKTTQRAKKTAISELGL